MTLFAASDVASTDRRMHPGQWRLARIEVVNWGTFDGFHAVDVARKGHLFTGGSGSGKSSLLDAIAAVLTPGRAITFNAAAQEAAGRQSDRTWITYVRGAWSKETDELEGHTVATYLRPRTTWSGIMLRFEDDVHKPVSLYRLFHLTGTSNDIGSLKELNFITRRADGLMTFAPYANRGIDKRRLDKDQDPVVSTTTGKHGAYFQRLQRLLGIERETALQLLHKTQAAKNLGTLDTLFRRYMLDAPATFAHADTAVEQFAELRDAYDHVVDLRRQRDALRAVADAANVYEVAERAAAQLSDIATAVEAFAIRKKLELSRDALIEADTKVRRAASDLERIQRESHVAREQWEAARGLLQQLGGGDLTAHQGRIDDAVTEREAIADRHQRLSERLTAAGIPAATTRVEYDDLCTAAQETLREPEPPPLDYDQLDRLSRARKSVADLTAQIQALERHRSNIDHRLLRIRDELCSELGVARGRLPFAGELISVRPDFAEWTGAIERALAPMSTALLVHDSDLGAVRRAVDRRHLGVNLTIDAVPATSERPLRAVDERSLVYRMDITDGIFADYLHRRISEEFDFACVSSPDELADVARGVTINGLVKRSGRRYIKADRHAVNDRSRWVLGGDIGPKGAELERLLTAARRDYEALQHATDAASAERDRLIRQRDLYREVLTIPWRDIDIAGADRRIENLRAAFTKLVDPDTDLGRASEAESAARGELEQLSQEENGATARHAVVESERDRIRAAIAELEDGPVADLTDTVAADLEHRFRSEQRVISFDWVDTVATKVQGQLRIEVASAGNRVLEASNPFVHQATESAQQWRAVVTNANLTPDIAERAGFREILDGIQSRGLPEHERNFRRLLENRSRESITFLRDDLLGVLRQIESRIAPINDSLSRSQFDRDRYLHVKVRLRRTQEVTDFLEQLGEIVRGNWSEEDLAGAERRFNVLAAIMQRLGSSERTDREWRGRVLDTREHVTFIAEEVDRNGTVHNVHDSSAGLSGGQRQKLVVFCLAAALRYQLADPEAAFPDYGAVILDEAFDKADAEYTRMAMDIFVAFGFQMILATPQKLLQTLEPYIGAVTVVTNPDRNASHLANVEF